MGASLEIGVRFLPCRFGGAGQPLTLCASADKKIEVGYCRDCALAATTAAASSAILRVTESIGVRLTGKRATTAREGDTMGELIAVAGHHADGSRRVGRKNATPTRQDLEMIERTRAARDLLSSKWKVDLLYLLARGVHRYSRLYDNLRGASKKMLTDSLRGLERDGFVDRTVYAEVPVRVEYSLTALGWSATELLMELADWADEHLGAVEQARLRYQEASGFGVSRPSDLSELEAA
jgi:DNA-binding HxlR family transcriptional regulator